MTLDDIRAEFSVSRSTAERMRSAVAAAFGRLEAVETNDPRRRWRLRAPTLHRFVAVSAEELREIGSSAQALERVGMEERASLLRRLAEKLRAAMRPESWSRIESNLEALLHAEGLAMRAGPKPRLDEGLLSRVREAITTRREVEFRYLAIATGRRSRQHVQPLGLLYGNRAFLVASSEWSEEPRLWRLANVSELRITDEGFERDPSFDSGAIRGAFVRHVPGRPRPGGPSIRCRDGPGCVLVPLPSVPVRRDERRRFGDGALRGGGNRRDVLAPVHLGGQRHHRRARPPPPAPRRDVRVACGPPPDAISTSAVVRPADRAKDERASGLEPPCRTVSEDSDRARNGLP